MLIFGAFVLKIFVAVHRCGLHTTMGCKYELKSPVDSSAVVFATF